VFSCLDGFDGDVRVGDGWCADAHQLYVWVLEEFVDVGVPFYAVFLADGFGCLWVEVRYRSEVD
jgi:hypothetical protein